jgi:hypothetical protein
LPIRKEFFGIDQYEKSTFLEIMIVSNNPISVTRAPIGNIAA